MTRRTKNPLRNRIYSKFELTSQEMYSRQLWELTLRYEGERITLVIITCTQFIFIHFGERTALHSFREPQDMYVFFVILKSILDQYQYLGNCPPTPPLTQQQSIDNKLGLMLGCPNTDIDPVFLMIQTQNKLSCRRHLKKKRAEGSLERNWRRWNKSMCKSVKTVT